VRHYKSGAAFRQVSYEKNSAIVHPVDEYFLLDEVQQKLKCETSNTKREIGRSVQLNDNGLKRADLGG
jgi:hypothetical protein